MTLTDNEERIIRAALMKIREQSNTRIKNQCDRALLVMNKANRRGGKQIKTNSHVTRESNHQPAETSAEPS